MAADGSLFGRVRGPIVIDLFAGGGGASLGISQALGVSPVVAINHCPNAIAMHMKNHPDTQHYLESVFDVKPLSAARGRKVDLLWASPDCKHFSKAKGGRPRDKNIRALAWIVVDWARDVRPRVIALENVEEFTTWGPLDDEGQPIKARSGETFRAFVAALEEHGYVVSWRILNAADYGAPTTRKRLFLIARCDGQAPVWPEPTHGAGRLPWRPAADCIDWSIPMLSIFATREEAKRWAKAVGADGIPQRPLAAATQRRIAEGVKRFVLGKKRPFLVNLLHGTRLDDLDAPMPTITAAHRGERAVVSPTLLRTDMHKSNSRCVYDPEDPLRTVTTAGGHAVAAASLLCLSHGGRPHDPNVPMPTLTATPKGGDFCLLCASLHAVDPAEAAAFMVANNSNNAPHAVDAPLGTVTTGGRHILASATLINTRNGERRGQRPRCRDIETPFPTVTAKGSQGAVSAIFLEQQHGRSRGRDVGEPLGTTTTVNHHAMCAAYLAQHNGTTPDKLVIGRSLEEPMQTAVGKINRGPVAVFLDKLHGSARAGQSVEEPMPTVTTGGGKGGGHAAPVAAVLGEPSRSAEVEADWRPRARQAAAFLRAHGVVADDGQEFVFVTIDQVVYVVVDIAMRMLVPEELKLANGFPKTYILVGNKEQQTARIGNSVCPQLSRAIAGANVGAAA